MGKIRACVRARMNSTSRCTILALLGVASFAQGSPMANYHVDRSCGNEDRYHHIGQISGQPSKQAFDLLNHLLYVLIRLCAYLLGLFLLSFRLHIVDVSSLRCWVGYSM